MSDTWTIGELAERAAALLGREPQADGPGPHVNGPGPRANGRVREVPNERLIRWYTTIGLLDPPLGRRGRVALYGRRHLLQLVAVKRRQADGLSIADIQAELTGATDAMLQRVAGLTEPATPDVARPPARDRFWAYPAAHADRTEAAADRSAPDLPGSIAAPSAAASRSAGSSPAPVAPSEALLPIAPSPQAARPLAPESPAHPDIAYPDVVHGIRLAPGVTVLLDPAYRAPDAHEVATLRRAAAPLLTALATLGLAGPFAGVHDAHPTHDTSAGDPHACDPLKG
ncbi:hypothetical protein GCM10010116_06220 [Microbispora rosea subsp. aerata]|nr:MerR family transcriptional regulator [Microbispora rosea]GGO03171.1 hypothetical protein GCM10010116_06220 [Microbispora rosea subsp. aerata]GIH54477.1 hypothetical protein Mro02_13910 [Microbispora rosea subsp. aerata]GLJ82743.1 hypothetical protein GCM10017588_14690 [Microbispora rosea subsp. aerata]